MRVIPVPTQAAAGDSATAPRRLHGTTIGVLVIGLVITGIVTWVAWTLNADAEDRLLHLQTAQAADVLSAAIPSTQATLATAAQLANATQGDPAIFRGYMSPLVGTGRQFTSASLWQSDPSGSRIAVVVGKAPALGPLSPQFLALERAALRSKSFAVTEVVGREPGLEYAYRLPGASQRFTVYGEKLVPGDRPAAIARNSAFSDLNYAIYFGRAPASTNLVATSVQQLPLTGRTASVRVTFGDQYLTLVTAPIGQLGGDVSQWLPWIFGVLGVVLTLAAVWITQRMVSRRQSAEGDRERIQELYDQLGQLYREQRTIAESLQLALLPQARPEISGLEIGVRYIPGASGVDIGGDWYSLVSIDARNFAFVIGDVSGRGIKAAAVMAALRFTIRALVLEGNTPAAVLEKCSDQAEAIIGEHFATVLVGLGNMDRRELTLANAGHLNPILLRGDSAEFVQTDVGTPLGVVGDGYRDVTISTPAKSTMVAFTDGLVERRGELLDVGLTRLASAARGTSLPVEGLLSKVVTELTNDASEDDLAIVALRWLD